MSLLPQPPHDRSQAERARYHPYSHRPEAGIRPSTSRGTNDRAPAPAGRGTTAILHPPAPAPVQRPPVTTTVTPHPLQATLDRIITGINEISVTLAGMQLEQQTHACRPLN
jgi:hypothetical protein